MFHILREEYQKAKHHISQAKDLYNKLDTSEFMLYCKIKKERLDGYCLACEVPVEGKQPNLTQQLLTSIKDQYTVCHYKMLKIHSNYYCLLSLLKSFFIEHFTNFTSR